MTTPEDKIIEVVARALRDEKLGLLGFMTMSDGTRIGVEKLILAAIQAYEQAKGE